MIIACICGGSLEAFLLILGLTSLMKGVNWLRRKWHSPKRCGCCKEHAAEHAAEHAVADAVETKKVDENV